MPLNPYFTSGRVDPQVLAAVDQKIADAVAGLDDVLEYANTAAFPVSGEPAILYVAMDTNKAYRWDGASYVEVGGGVAPTSGTTTCGVNMVSGAVTSGTATVWYQQVGSIVHMDGHFSVDTTAGSVTTFTVRVALPVASNFSGGTQARGTATGINGVTIPLVGIVGSIAVDDNVYITMVAASAIGNAQTVNVGFSLSYTVI